MRPRASTIVVNAGQQDRAESPVDAGEREDPLLQRLLDTARTASAVPAGVMVGELVGFIGDDRMPLVCFAGQPTAMQARSAANLRDTDIGAQVVLMFESADPAKPIVLGALDGRREIDAAKTVTLEMDGERVVLLARDQLVLRCGRASITLTKAGKILIHGEYISTRSNGINRIRGGTVEIN